MASDQLVSLAADAIAPAFLFLAACKLAALIAISPGTPRQADGSWIIHATRIPAAISINGRADADPGQCISDRADVCAP